MQESGFSRFPVCGEDTDDIKGIVLAREYLFALQNQPDLTLNDLMQEAKFVPESLPANRLFRDMRENQIHMAFVIDEYGQIAGLITMENLLEEIVGSIYDETDAPEAPEIVELEENRWQIAGSATVEDVEQAIGVTLRREEDTFDTFGGFVFSKLEYIPQEDDMPEFTYENLAVKVLSVREKRIETTEVIKTEIAQDEDAEATAASTDLSDTEAVRS